MEFEPAEFEKEILFAITTLKSAAYGVGIKRELEGQFKKTLSIGAVHSALKRLEDKGVLKSAFGEATTRRAGNRKRIYSPTPYAHRILREINATKKKWPENRPGQLRFSLPLLFH